MKYCVSVTHLSTGEVEPELILSVSENKKKQMNYLLIQENSFWLDQDASQYTTPSQKNACLKDLSLPFKFSDYILS